MAYFGFCKFLNNLSVLCFGTNLGSKCRTFGTKTRPLVKLAWTRLDSPGNLVVKSIFSSYIKESIQTGGFTLKLVWTRLDSSGLGWTHLDSAGLGWTRSLFSCIHSNSWEYLVFKLDSAGLVWTRLDSSGLVWTRLDSFIIFLYPF